MVIALTVVVGVLLLSAVALLVLAVIQQRTLAIQRRRIDQLEVDLDAALRPRPAATTTEKALRRVVRTVDRVRERGVAGLLEGSIEDLQRWASEERTDIVSMASSNGHVTLFFSDIEDSTALNSRFGDGVWVRVLAAHDQLLRVQIEKYRGQVVKSAGDGFMVAFRDPEAACRAAVGIQKDLRRTLDPRLRFVTPAVKVRIGIHTGKVVSRDGDYFGSNVAMAARVADLAEGGEVLASSAVLEELDEDAHVDLTEIGEVELKGLPGTHIIYRVEPV